MDKPLDILFLCTGNSARSVLAEALANHLGAGRVRAHSAGSFPAGIIQPRTLSTLHKLQLSTEGLRSKSWTEFSAPGATPMDFVFTVCDQAAGEVCPVWPGQPISAHWGVPDPVAAVGDDAQLDQVFLDTALVLKRRIELLLALPMATLDRLALTQAARDIGQR
jgi:arsenate reductase